MFDLSQALWKKARRSNGADTGCVEVAANFSGITAVRDSQNPDRGAHIVRKAAFATFIEGVRKGDYDLPR